MAWCPQVGDPRTGPTKYAQRTYACCHCMCKLCAKSHCHAAGSFCAASEGKPLRLPSRQGSACYQLRASPGCQCTAATPVGVYDHTYAQQRNYTHRTSEGSRNSHEYAVSHSIATSSVSSCLFTASTMFMTMVLQGRDRYKSCATWWYSQMLPLHKHLRACCEELALCYCDHCPPDGRMPDRRCVVTIGQTGGT